MFIGRTDAEAETPILCHLMRRVDSLEKTLMLGGIGGRKKRGRQRVRWLDGITDSMDVYLTYMQSTSREMPGGMKHKLELRLPGEISITSDVHMTPPLWQKAKN